MCIFLLSSSPFLPYPRLSLVVYPSSSTALSIISISYPCTAQISFNDMMPLFNQFPCLTGVRQVRRDYSTLWRAATESFDGPHYQEISISTEKNT